ncbi:hypothetical protein V0U79_09575 [Hyphobacterium sp. HN65]|uniref:Uncharacterized protein n=1 Tax=Hyphobacterium lacteum TaxID=3116575 RepID=A0ABU7LRS7_9PROT|nr:hypothetical protein [Hyphobacterium sp. HN65]MEE2526616.1 hypothetical protein [Hyphobacterium sp. HN65]
MRTLRHIFALIVSAGVFLFLTYVFGIFMNPQGQGGWIAALVLITTAGIGCVLLYGWIARGGPSHLDRRVRTDTGSLGLGLSGVGIAASRRRRDDTDDPSDDDGGGDDPDADLRGWG